VPANYASQLHLPPSSAHLFGTDGYGRDVLSRVMHGSRVSLSLSVAAVSLALLLGTAYGALAGLLGGTVDRLLMRVLDVALAMPRLLLLLAVTAFFPTRLPLTAFVILLGCTGWFDVARLVRGEVQSLMHRDFMLAARTLGVPLHQQLWGHLLPHLFPLLAVTATLNVASTITLEAGLSFLGFGVQPPTPSWGNIMLDGADALFANWWLTLFPGLAIILAVLTCHALGDALRDRFAGDQLPA
jgi:peptide/nickel transport system permease protein